MGYFEAAFDIFYLITVLILSVIIIRKGLTKHSKAIILFGIMGFLLGFGDAFHLVPRILAHLTTGMDAYQTALGVGKLITSVTMTIFYYLIYWYYVLVTGKYNKSVHITLIALIVIRFALLALPGNDWLNNGTSLFYGILRNIPFAVIGGIIVTLFLKVGQNTKFVTFKKMGYWIIVSFICYSIVVIGSGFIPALGAFMLPKTVAYLIIVYLGFKEA